MPLPPPPHQDPWRCLHSSSSLCFSPQLPPLFQNMLGMCLFFLCLLLVYPWRIGMEFSLVLTALLRPVPAHSRNWSTRVQTPQKRAVCMCVVCNKANERGLATKGLFLKYSFKSINWFLTMMYPSCLHLFLLSSFFVLALSVLLRDARASTSCPPSAR